MGEHELDGKKAPLHLNFETLKPNLKKPEKVKVNKNIRNYSVPKVAIKCKAFKTLFPDLMVVSIIDLRTANTFALSSDLN